MKIYIYSLQDPITQEIRYVGKTKNPKMRFHNHMNTRHNEHTHKRNWINSLKELHLRPCMLILDEVSEDDWKFWEKYWIQQCIVWGFNLVNHTSGGEGSISGNSTSFKKGQVSWNKGTIHNRLCPQCNKYFKPNCNNSKQIYCSLSCAGKNRVSNTQFDKNHIPWNKGITGYTTTKKGCGISEEIKQKISNTLKGRESLRKRKIIQYDKNMNKIKEFESITKASLETNVLQTSISNCLNGKTKKAGGFIWR